MRYTKNEICAIFLLVCGLTTLQAQQAVVASGGTATGSGTVSYSIGQVVYTTNSNSGSVAQGVQQPYEISVLTGVKDAKDITLEFVVYPNPDDKKLKGKRFNQDKRQSAFDKATVDKERKKIKVKSRLKEKG